MSDQRRLPATEILKQRARVWPEAVTPVAEVMVRVLRFSDLALAAAGRRVATHGLSLTGFGVLAALRSAFPHEMAPTELTAAVLVSSGELTKVLIALEEKSLVSRAEGATDRRSKPVRLTDHGRSVVEKAMADLLRADAAFLDGALSGEDVAHVTRLLDRLLDRLETA